MPNDIPKYNGSQRFWHFYASGRYFMAYNPNIHHRRSIRLQGYDYSQAGLYFVTICIQHRECLFGEIMNGVMILNDAGEMIKKWWLELPHKFSDITLGECVVMPNHFHAIIINTGNYPNNKNNAIIVGADLRVCPDNAGVCLDNAGVCLDNAGVCPDNGGDCYNNLGTNIRGAHIQGAHIQGAHIQGAHIGAPLRDTERGLGEHAERGLGEHAERGLGEHAERGLGEHTGSPLHTVVQWFKTMTTNEYIRGVKTLGWMPFDKKLWQRNYYEHIIRNGNEHKKIMNYIIANPVKWQDDKFFEPDKL
ncbi:hypothetical protein AGMMS4956_00100 [Bacteroidia bacterium]|nr:hypothetical protein AGMMS4956_00100 [Bacteroidia bacterium]